MASHSGRERAPPATSTNSLVVPLAEERPELPTGAQHTLEPFAGVYYEAIWNLHRKATILNPKQQNSTTCLEEVRIFFMLEVCCGTNAFSTCGSTCGWRRRCTGKWSGGGLMDGKGRGGCETRKREICDMNFGKTNDTDTFPKVFVFKHDSLLPRANELCTSLSRKCPISN